jgi:hypothetical protein
MTTPDRKVRGGGRRAVFLVQAGESLAGDVLVAEHLDDLETVDHLLDIAVESSQRLLLRAEEPGALLAERGAQEDHERQDDRGDANSIGLSTSIMTRCRRSQMPEISCTTLCSIAISTLSISL